jgi:hypothetical protein
MYSEDREVKKFIKDQEKWHEHITRIHGDHLPQEELSYTPLGGGSHGRPLTLAKMETAILN